MATLAGLEQWHSLVESRDPSGLVDLIADDCQFHSPVLFKPQVGKDLVIMYLTGAVIVLGSPDFHYVREVVEPPTAVLEFETLIDGKTINGIDMITFQDGKIIDFKVMVRPLSALNLVQEKMAALLAQST